MKKNHTVEILLTIVSLFLILIGFNTVIHKYFVNYDFGSEYVFGIEKAVQNNPFPVYEHKNTKQTFNHNYAVGLPPAIAPIGTRRNVQHLGTANANSNAHMPSYSVNAKAAETTIAREGSAFGGMQAMAFQSTSKVTSNATGNAIRSFYNTRFNDNTSSSKVPFSSSAPNDVILVDPKADPLEENRIPIGSGEPILLILGLIYLKFKSFFKRINNAR